MTRRRPYALGLLLAVFAVNFMDRQILAVLAPSLQRELGLSDTELGLLSGFAFAIFYTALGIPLAGWADRHDRRRLIAASVAVFSVMTALCGLAGGFVSLLLARIGVAVGEAGTNPASHSLIADLYPERERATAMGLFALGPNLGLFLGFLVGGGLDQWLGWRTAFLGAGLPGLALALVVVTTLAEPRRRDSGGAGGEERISFNATLRRMSSSSALRHAVTGAAFASAVGYGVLGWLPMFLARSHQLASARAGLVLALVVGLGGGVGTYFGGRLADRWAARDARWLAGVPALALALSAPAWAAVFLLPKRDGALALLAVPGVLLAVYLGPTFALVQNLVTPRQRATAAAITLFVANLVGFGAGPLAVGVASDLLAPRLGADSLRWALVGLSALALWAAAHYAAAARALGRAGRD